MPSSDLGHIPQQILLNRSGVNQPETDGSVEWLPGPAHLGQERLHFLSDPAPQQSSSEFDLVISSSRARSQSALERPLERLDVDVRVFRHPTDQGNQPFVLHFDTRQPDFFRTMDHLWGQGNPR